MILDPHFAESRKGDPSQESGTLDDGLFVLVYHTFLRGRDGVNE
jgi:hypothetical protein